MNIANQLSIEFAENAIRGNRAGMNKVMFEKLREQSKILLKADGFSSKTITYIDNYFDELQGKIRGDFDVKSYFAKLAKQEGGQYSPIENI